MKPLDLQSVNELWDALALHFGTRDVVKSRSWLMRAIARFLAVIRVLPRQAFLLEFTTTIGHAIYLPLDRRAPCDEAECWRRLVLCVHEHQHVAQWQRGPVRFVLGYLLSRTRRAEHEAQAYGTALELAAWAGRPLPDPAEMAQRLQYYGVGPAHIRHAEGLLRAIAVRAQTGEITTEAARVAVAWWAGRAD
jgi:hypothetical protein